MLNRNIYLIYPAGYHGNFVKWAIEVSDSDNHTVIKDPINTSTSTQWGGIGTAHNHVRIPTHQDLRLHDMWYMFNRPADHRVYLINTGSQRFDISEQISRLLLQDRTGIVINLHDGDDDRWAAYGRINCVTKWPTFMAVSKWFVDLHSRFDPFDCADDRIFRNHLVENQPLGSCGRPDRDRIQVCLDQYQTWFNGRNRYQPHEVNYETYPEMPDLSSRFFDFSLEEILHPDFALKLENLLSHINVIDNVDCAPVHDIHSQYMSIQPNLKWLVSVDDWERTGILDPYLLSHSVIQAEIILRIFNHSNIAFSSDEQIALWLYTYNNKIRDTSWPRLDDPHDFVKLPRHIQDELVNQHRLQPLPVNPDYSDFADWRQMSLIEINGIYQNL